MLPEPWRDHGPWQADWDVLPGCGSQPFHSSAASDCRCWRAISG